MLAIVGKHSQIVVLERGDKVMETLTRYITENAIHGGLITGIGGLKEVEIGYYDLQQQTYLRKKFNDQDFELISFNGNIALNNQAPFIHAHVLLGRRDFSTFGGHFFEATVAITAELTIFPLGKMPKRGKDPWSGASLICGFNP